MSVADHRTGEISSRSISHEWTIGDIFSYTAEDVCRDSPSFDAWGSRWCLRIYPNGEARNNSVGWIGLCLFRERDSSPPQRASFTLGVKSADGTVEQEMDCTFVFDDENDEGYGVTKLLKRSDLLRCGSKLAPSDALTVTCSSLSVDVDLRPSRTLGTDILSTDLLEMFTSRRGCDATLKVKQEEFPVHKFVLAARSLVLAAMFGADMKEKRTGVVDIEDCEPGPFREFLKYLYSGKAADLPGNAFELYRLADKYGVGGLKPACVLSIVGDLSLENVLEAALLGHQFSEHEITIKCHEFFNEHFGEILLTAQWKPFMMAEIDLADELLKSMASKMGSNE